MLNAKWASDIFSSNQKSHTGCPITLVYTVHRVRQWKVPFSTTVYYGNSWSKSHFTMLLTTAQTMVGVINNLSQILFPARGIRERSLLYYDKWPHYFLHQWYFVCKIVLTYCEKKNLIEIFIWNSRLKAGNLQNVWDHLIYFFKQSEQFLKQNSFLNLFDPGGFSDLIHKNNYISIFKE